MNDIAFYISVAALVIAVTGLLVALVDEFG